MQVSQESLKPIERVAPEKKRLVQVEANADLFKEMDKVRKSLGHTLRTVVEYGMRAYVAAHKKKE